MRVVVKIGSSSLAQSEGGLDPVKLRGHVEALAALRAAGHEVVVVSSGAVASGFRALGYSRRPQALKAKQAAAAVGQSILMREYTDAFTPFGLAVGQILLTRHDFTRKSSFTNAHVTIEELLAQGAVPIINENDTVATQELRFGDNDVLSALVSGMIHAQFLLIVTDIDGLYSANPRTDPEAKRIGEVSEISPAMLESAGGAGSAVGTGGMRTKLIAAHRALSLGVPVFVGRASGPQSLLEVLNRKGAGTYFGGDPGIGIARRKQWIAFHAEARGTLLVDDGAAMALLQGGRSLLPVGVTSIRGEFEREDVVEIVHTVGDHELILGRGVTELRSTELELVRGKSSAKTRELLRDVPDEVIHRDNFVCLRGTLEEDNA